MVTEVHSNWMSRIKSGDEEAFRLLFDAFYPSLCNYAFRFLNDYDQAEEVVQGLFVRIWEKRSELNMDTSVKNYLFRSVRNLSVNLITHEKVRMKHADRIRETLLDDNAADTWYLDPETAKRIGEAIEALPEKRKEIFILSRQEGLKYRQIAERLRISVKTVETQMGLALKTLRTKLRSALFQIFL